MKLLLTSKYFALGFISILLLLHVINPEINPSWQPISEYALGNLGWLMNLAFILLGVSFFCLGWFIVGNIPKIGSKIGGWMLILASLGNIMAGLFNTDPVGTLPEHMTTSGEIHGASAGFLGFMVLATLFILYQFYKQDVLKPFKKPIVYITLLVWLCEIIMVISMGIYLSGTNGLLTPDMPIGGLGRLVILVCTAWIFVLASTFLKIKKTNSELFI